MEECLQVLTWQGVVVESSGNVFVTRSDKMDNLVMKGIVVAFNNVNSVFAATMKDADQILAALKEAHESCKGQYKHVQEGLQKAGGKHALQLAVSYTRNMRTLYGLIASLQAQKAAVQRDLAVVSHSVCWSVTYVYKRTYVHTYVHELMTECSPS